MITDEMILEILNLTTHPPCEHEEKFPGNNREGIGTFLGTNAELIASVRTILDRSEDG